MTGIDDLIRQAVIAREEKINAAATDLVSRGIIDGRCTALYLVTVQRPWLLCDDDLKIMSSDEVWICCLPHKHDGQHLIVREDREIRW